MFWELSGNLTTIYSIVPNFKQLTCKWPFGNILFASRELPVLLILGVEFPWLAAFHYNTAILKYFPAEFQFCERLLWIPYGEKKHIVMVDRWKLLAIISQAHPAFCKRGEALAHRKKALKFVPQSQQALFHGISSGLALGKPSSAAQAGASLGSTWMAPSELP